MILHGADRSSSAGGGSRVSRGDLAISFSCTPSSALLSRKQGRFLTFTSQNPKSDNSLSGGIFQVQIKAISFFSDNCAIFFVQTIDYCVNSNYNGFEGISDFIGGK